MSDKTEMLIVEVEKDPTLYGKGSQDFKDTEKKEKCVETYCTGSRVNRQYTLRLSQPELPRSV